MKKLFAIGALVSLAVLGAAQSATVGRPSGPKDPIIGATCSPSGTCRACSNCKYCANCSKRGGTCSVCR